MSGAVEVRSIDALRSALVQFESRARDDLNAAKLEIQRTFDWLNGRRAYWQREIQRRQADVRRAQAALAACQAAAALATAASGGRAQPSCYAQEMAVLQAQVRLREAEAELRSVEQWIRLIGQVADEYRREAERMATVLDHHLPKATAFLAAGVGSLQGYLSATIPSGLASVETGAVLGTGTAGGTFSTQPPVQDEIGAGRPEMKEGNAGGPERRG